ncbi:MAG: polysaccharide pyruvyl transferase family protein [Planctomycetales bacterium]|nr:polysaccharide pyruvyl transferase family protein [Planctomycetales bacterium]
MRRRQFLEHVVSASSCCGLAGILKAQAAGAKKVVLRSSWQTVNIGDIAHTPGVLRLLEKHLPNVEVWLWASKLDNGVDRVLAENFPHVRILNGESDIQQAFRQCDFLLHGSGASFVAERDVRRWHEATGKPFGVYGITLGQRSSSATQNASDDSMSRTIGLLSQAAFVFFRDSVSLAYAKGKGCSCPKMQFGPDGAFAADLRDAQAAAKFLEQNKLEAGKFLCCIPRLRYTPYWTIPSKQAAFDEIKHLRNEEMKEHDHAQLREAVVRVIEETDLKVLVCPEDQTQMQVGYDLIYSQLNSSIRERVVWRPNYWLTGEAISTYICSAGLFGNEMHSPIMCIGHGIPAIVCRFAEQTSKGTMWRDIGLSDWLFDLDDPTQVDRIVPAVLEMAKQPEKAKDKAFAARGRVEELQSETMSILNSSLS